jgi:transcription antitermination factor NusG
MSLRRTVCMGVTWRYLAVNTVLFSARRAVQPENASVLAKSLNEAWFAVSTKPRHEKFVHARLMAKRIRSFLPLYTAVRQWRNGARREVRHPLWPGYLFVCVGADERIPVLVTPGVRHIIGEGSSALALDDHEMHALGICGQCEWLLRHPFLSTVNTVCITRGPLQGLKGQVERVGRNLLFVVSFQVIQRSFAFRVRADDIKSCD